MTSTLYLTRKRRHISLVYLASLRQAAATGKWQQLPPSSPQWARLASGGWRRAQVSRVGVELELLLVGVAAERGGERIGRLKRRVLVGVVVRLRRAERLAGISAPDRGWCRLRRGNTCATLAAEVPLCGLSCGLTFNETRRGCLLPLPLVPSCSDSLGRGGCCKVGMGLFG